MKTPLATIIALSLILFLSCSDSTTGPTRHTVKFSATVTACRCPGWSPILNYVVSTGHSAAVTLTGADGVSYISGTNSMSEVTFDVDTGLYIVTVQTYHMPPRQASPIHLTHDSSGLELLTYMDVDPADSMIAEFFYPNSDTTDAQVREHDVLARLNKAMDGMLDLSHAQRSVPDTESWNGWIQYGGIGIPESTPWWFVKQVAEQVIANDRDEVYPWLFSLEPYAIICLAAEPR
jgi:hypothetical protein